MLVCSKASDGNRTHVFCLEGRRTSRCTTPAYKRRERDSNPCTDFRRSRSLANFPLHQLGYPSIFKSPINFISMIIGLLWSQMTDLNPRPADYKSAALPTVLIWHVLSVHIIGISYISISIYGRASDGNRTHILSLEG